MTKKRKEKTKDKKDAGNPQTENGYTQIANELYEAVNLFPLTKRQAKVVHWSIRNSYGWQRKYAPFKLVQISTDTGILLRHVRPTIKQLEALNILWVNWEENQLGINKKYRQWQDPKYPKQVPRQVPKTGTPGTQNRNLKYPKQEPKVPKTGTSTQAKQGSANGLQDPKESIKERKKNKEREQPSTLPLDDEIRKLFLKTLAMCKKATTVDKNDGWMIKLPADESWLAELLARNKYKSLDHLREVERWGTRMETARRKKEDGQPAKEHRYPKGWKNSFHNHLDLALKYQADRGEVAKRPLTANERQETQKELDTLKEEVQRLQDDPDEGPTKINDLNVRISEVKKTLRQGSVQKGGFR